MNLIRYKERVFLLLLSFHKTEKSILIIFKIYTLSQDSFVIAKQ